MRLTQIAALTTNMEKIVRLHLHVLVLTQQTQMFVQATEHVIISELKISKQLVSVIMDSLEKIVKSKVVLSKKSKKLVLMAPMHVINPMYYVIALENVHVDQDMWENIVPIILLDFGNVIKSVMKLIQVEVICLRLDSPIVVS